MSTLSRVDSYNPASSRGHQWEMNQSVLQDSVLWETYWRKRANKRWNYWSNGSRAAESPGPSLTLCNLPVKSQSLLTGNTGKCLTWKSQVEKANKCRSILLNSRTLSPVPQPTSRALTIMCTLPSWERKEFPSGESHWPRSKDLPTLVSVSIERDLEI